ncbi:MAG: 50S ribosomal protein L9 [Gemmatimonadota bacterium]|nr:MAG: 50S ribosomal protein L9 [Gemmatimonadota bacterium]
MKVILRKSIESLGRTGEVVDVANGYARNYLLPKSFAYAITSDNLKRIEKEKVRFEAEEKERLASLNAFAEKLKSVSCSIEANANEEGHLFGSVTPAMIVEALAKDGIELDAKSIQLEKPIKETGVFSVPVHLHADINSELKVWVMDSNEDAKGGDGEGGDATDADGAEPESNESDG